MSKRLSLAVTESIRIWGVLALIVIAGFVVAFQYIGVAPPRAIRIATGAENGAYYGFARQYAEVLAKDGISLEVVPTAGSVENLALLRKGEVSLALIQGGSAGVQDKEGLQSLGSLFLEPVWIFMRAQKPAKRLAELKGRRVAVGAPGSGTYLLAMQLLLAAGIDESNATLLQGSGADAVAWLAQGKADAAIFVASPAAPIVRGLLHDPALELLSFDRAPAYARLFPFLAPVILNEGIVDLARNIPARDTSLVAASASLAAREDLNANLIPALLNAVGRVHQAGGLLEQRRQFPSAEFTDLPMNEDARRYIADGPSFLFRWLPYGTAVLLDRLKILLLPLVALLIPLVRIAPPLYIWRIRSKIYRWYATVREIDSMIGKEMSPSAARSAVERLQELEREVASISVPLSYTGELYHLRLHIGFLQQRLEPLARGSARTGAESSIGAT